MSMQPAKKLLKGHPALLCLGFLLGFSSSSQAQPARNFSPQSYYDQPVAAFMTRVTQTHTDLLKGHNIPLPHYKVALLCSRQTQRGSVSYNACIANNQEAYDALKTRWASRMSDARLACVRQTATASAPGYDTLAQCLDAVEETKQEAP